MEDTRVSNQPASGSPPVQATRGRHLARTVAVFVTGLSLWTIAFGFLAVPLQLDVPLLPQFYELGRRFLPESELPYVPVLAPLITRGIWGAVLALDRRETVRAKRNEARWRLAGAEETPSSVAPR